MFVADKEVKRISKHDKLRLYELGSKCTAKHRLFFTRLFSTRSGSS